MTTPLSSDVAKALGVAKAAMDRGDLNAAQVALAQIADRGRDVVQVALMQGVVARRQARLDQAHTHLTHAAALAPQAPPVLAPLAQVQAEVGEVDAAFATYDRLIKAEPATPKWSAEKALLLQQTGDFKASAKLLRKTLRKHPQAVDLYRLLTFVERLKPADPLVRAMHKMLVDPRLNDHGRAQLNYALAKVAEDTGATDRVFAHLHRANGAQRKLAPYADDQAAADLKAVMAAQSGLKYPSFDADGFGPIFVVGTPRSGTTLVERILSAHPQVTAVGETGFANRGSVVVLGPEGQRRPVASVDLNIINGFARAYTRHIQGMGVTTPHSVDKSMMLHALMGLLRFALPGARFVVMHRDPRDIAVSIYRHHFPTGQHRYSTDLGDIARYIQRFRRAVSHWEAALPEAPHVLHYEDLVTDPEGQTRALIAAMGLDWDPACLESHRHGGTVKTLSLQQVRQPIYASQARAWTKYSDALKPFDQAWEHANGSD